MKIIENKLSIYRNNRSIFRFEFSFEIQFDRILKPKFFQAKTEQLRCDYNHLMEDTSHYRNQILNYQTLKSSIVDEINRQRDFTQRTQMEVEDLKMQKQLNIQTHEADVQVRFHSFSFSTDIRTMLYHFH